MSGFYFIYSIFVIEQYCKVNLNAKNALQGANFY